MNSSQSSSILSIEVALATLAVAQTNYVTLNLRLSENLLK